MCANFVIEPRVSLLSHYSSFPSSLPHLSGVSHTLCSSSSLITLSPAESLCRSFSCIKDSVHFPFSGGINAWDPRKCLLVASMNMWLYCLLHPFENTFMNYAFIGIFIPIYEYSKKASVPVTIFTWATEDQVNRRRGSGVCCCPPGNLGMPLRSTWLMPWVHAAHHLRDCCTWS